MTISVDVQYASLDNNLPDEKLIVNWVTAALTEQKNDDVELTVRIVDENEGRALNERWRKTQKATNVLSFPAGEIAGLSSPFLGDIIVCAPVIVREANQQNKMLLAHWAHMVVHGTLHLLGYDHDNNKEAQTMESIEIDILNKLGFANPYD